MIQIKSQKDDSGSEFCADVHKELLCFYSPYYTAAIKGGFCESHQESFTLELDCVQTRIFVDWLYTGRCDTDPWQEIDDSDMHTLYIFADKTDIIAFRRSIMTSIVALARTPAAPEELVNVVSVLPDDSGLRLFLLEEAVAEWRFNADEVVVTEEDWKMRGYFPKDFSPEFWDQLVNGEHDPYLPSCIACDFHEHTDEEEWKMSKEIEQKLPYKSSKLTICASLRHPFRYTPCDGT
jgi:hypothetical protein